MWMISACVLFCHIGHAQPASPEYKLKAVFLFNFVQFVEWPQTAFKDTNSPLVLAVLGNDPFGSYLDATVTGEIVRGRRIEVRRYRSVNEIHDCHVLFISASESPNLKAILARLNGRSVLTVGDIPDFASRGGMIQFYKDQNKIRFRINIQAAKEAHLSVSAKLLQLAEVVPERRP